MKPRNQPKDHHYVPQSYLRNFVATDIKKLYTFNKKFISLPHNGKFRSYPPSQVCHSLNLYLIKNKGMMKNFNIDDPYVVETKVLKYYEDRYEKILCKIALQREWISITEAEILIKFLLYMKMRNPVFFNHENSKSGVIEVNERIKQDIINNEEIWLERLANENLTKEQAFKKLEELSSAPDITYDLTRLALFQMEEFDSTISEITRKLLQKVWSIKDTTISDMYITSDNPGFCINEEEVLMNTNFIEGFCFIFPLTPHKALWIVDNKNDILIPPVKKIEYTLATPKAVQIVNRCTFAGATEYIYSNSQRPLNATIEHWKTFFKITA